KVWATGCSNWRTIHNSGPYMFWANGDGVWISVGGQPKNISGPIKELIDAGTPTNFFAAVVDEEYHLYLGNITVDGKAYVNVDATFNIATSTWRWRELGSAMTTFARKMTSGVQKLYMGGTAYVWEKGKHTDSTLLNDDDGTAIKSFVEFAPINLKNFSLEKESNRLTAFANRAQGMKIYWRVIDNNSRKISDYKPLGELTKFVNEFGVNLKGGVLLQLAISESGSRPYWSFLGFDLDISPYSEIIKT
ncbi:MAG: hypothetical protein KKH44_10565, partial [Bacteroidetes bacterium]|nr:hypothetical protein [Bacteroidota bacterium]